MFSLKKESHRAMTYDSVMSECVDTLWCFQCNSHEIQLHLKFFPY